MLRKLRKQLTIILYLSAAFIFLFVYVNKGPDTNAVQQGKFWQIVGRLQATTDLDPSLVFDVPALPPDTANKAILLSYMRAGTTFLGSVFEKNDDIFYVFEPEWGLIFGSLNEYETLKYIDGSTRGPYSISDGDGVISEAMYNYLYCNITAIDVRSLSGRFMNEGQDTRALYKCVRQKGAKLQHCVKELTDVCRRKPVRFLKTVRLRMETMLEVLRKDPSLKIIHMIRDPRGIAMSRMGWAEFYKAKKTFTFGRVCGEILRDIEVVESLSPDVAKRVYPVLYEDVADNPEAMTKKLYEFLGIKVPEKVKNYVYNITHARKDKREGFSTIRSNSSRTAYSWRLRIDWKLCEEIDKLCRRVYEKVGYLRAKSVTDLRNWNIPLRKVVKNSSYADKRY